MLSFSYRIPFSVYLYNTYPFPDTMLDPCVANIKRLSFAVVGHLVQGRIWYLQIAELQLEKKSRNGLIIMKIDACWNLTRHFIKLWFQLSLSNCGQRWIVIKFSNIWFYNHCEFITREICLNVSSYILVCESTNQNFSLRRFALKPLLII